MPTPSDQSPARGPAEDSSRLADEVTRFAQDVSDLSLRREMLAKAEQVRVILESEAKRKEEERRERKKHAKVMGIFSAFAVAFAWLLAFLRGFDAGSIVVALAMSTIFGLAWYFETRDREAGPTQVEAILAWLWLWLRLIVGVVGGLLFLGLPLAIVFLKGIGDVGAPKPGTLIVSALLGLLCLWVGFAGWSKSIRRDPQLHAERRKRYGWPL